jgi:hypothetical protein
VPRASQIPTFLDGRRRGGAHGRAVGISADVELHS